MFGMLEPASQKDLTEKMLGQRENELKKQVKMPEGGSNSDK